MGNKHTEKLRHLSGNEEGHTDALAFPTAQLVKNPPTMQETRFDSWVGKICWKKEWLPTAVFWPGEFHGLYSPRGHKESEITETFTTHSQAVHLQMKDKRKALSSHFWLTFRVCTTRKSGRVKNCLVEL